MAAGAGGEAVSVWFKITDSAGNLITCEAFIPARSWARCPDDNSMSNRQWWMDVTKTPWVWNTDLAPADGPYDEAGAVVRFGNEVPWGSVGTSVRQAAPWQVVRCNGIDYAFGPGVFVMINTPDTYWFLLSANLISIPHGSAPVIAENLRDFIREWALRGLQTGTSSPDQQPQPGTAITGV